MDTRNSSTSTPYRPSCRGTRSNCSRAQRKRPLRRPDSEPRRREKTTDRSGPPLDGAATGRAMVVGPYLRRQKPKSFAARAEEGQRAPAARLDEAVGLARAIDLDVVEAGLAPLNDIRPATYLGKGKGDELAGIVKGHDISVVVMDCA